MQINNVRAALVTQNKLNEKSIILFCKKQRKNPILVWHSNILFEAWVNFYLRHIEQKSH